ncbi:MAG: hypothetical protein Q8N99_08540 [Nanoarchaeota archaeon]|nr:hypothetical protein [Nanoarchaeota archaeon]
MKTNCLTAILSSAILIPVISGCTGEVKVETQKKPSIESKVERANPLENCEAYEIDPGKYSFFVETDAVCFIPFKTIDFPEGRIYFKRLDPKNSFNKPLRLSKDSFMNQYTLELGKYEIWVENNGFFAPVDKLIPNKEAYDEKVAKIKIHNREPLKESPNQEQNEKAPLPPALPIAPAPTPELPPAPSPAPGLPLAPKYDSSA